MHKRIRKLRKALGLTLEKFGECVGVTKSGISKLEKGERSVTDQMFKSICREFNVSPEWLETGEGEMFLELDKDDELFQVVGSVLGSDDEFLKSVYYYLGKAPQEIKDALQQFVEDIYQELHNKKDAPIYKLPNTPEKFEN